MSSICHLLLIQMSLCQTHALIEGIKISLLEISIRSVLSIYIVCTGSAACTRCIDLFLVITLIIMRMPFLLSCTAMLGLCSFDIQPAGYLSSPEQIYAPAEDSDEYGMVTWLTSLERIPIFLRDVSVDPLDRSQEMYRLNKALDELKEQLLDSPLYSNRLDYETYTSEMIHETLQAISLPREIVDGTLAEVEKLTEKLVNGNLCFLVGSTDTSDTVSTYLHDIVRVIRLSNFVYRAQLRFAAEDRIRQINGEDASLELNAVVDPRYHYYKYPLEIQMQYDSLDKLAELARSFSGDDRTIVGMYYALNSILNRFLKYQRDVAAEVPIRQAMDKYMNVDVREPDDDVTFVSELKQTMQSFRTDLARVYISRAKRNEYIELFVKFMLHLRVFHPGIEYVGGEPVPDIMH